MEKIKVGILKETKTPPDRRVALPPKQALELLNKFPEIELWIQKSEIRAYSDEEFLELGLNLCDNLNHCDILIGIKEVEISNLIAGKTYLFFSHTAKKQKHNRGLLQAIVRNKIRLIDYEYLTAENGIRVIAFGRWAGIVGAYNAILALGNDTGKYEIKRAIECFNLDECFKELKKADLPDFKFVLTGGGRVASGAMEILDYLGIMKVNPDEFLNKKYNFPVYTQLDPWLYVRRTDGKEFEWTNFSNYPENYESIFLPFAQRADVLIACHYWDPKAPVFLTKNEMQHSDINIKLIADISCDINGSIPATIRTSSIKDPFWKFSTNKWSETKYNDPAAITMMTVDNLPGELPRDASEDFAKTLIDKVFPSLFGNDTERIIERATITDFNGKLTDKFAYLQDYLNGM